MGVTGLTTFLAKCGEKYTDPIYVHNKVVVVDGCNLMYHLYFHGTVTRFSPHLFGGDCISFAQKVREYFQKLKLCNILPIVIFDGAYEAGKLKTVMKRFGKSLKENVQNKIPGKSYTSVLIKLVFLEILVEQNIDHFQTEFEADDTIAFVAKKLHAPVLSSDSDFFIYSSITTVPLNTIDFKRVQLKKDDHKKTQKVVDPNVKPFCLVGKSITLREMCQTEFRLSDYRLLPLTVVVIGNDQISTKIFSKFMNTKGGGFKVKKNDRISFLLKWFGRQVSYDIALEVMLGSVKEVEREKVRELVEQVVKNYMSDGGEEKVWNLIKSSKAIQNQVDIFKNDNQNMNENVDKSEVEEEDGQDKEEVDGRRKKKIEATESLCELLKDMDLGSAQQMENNKDKNNKNDQVEDDDDSQNDSEDDGDDDGENDNLAINEFKKLKELPEWYLQDHRKCSLLTYLIKIYSNRALFLTPQVEMTSMPSSHAISVPIIQVTAGILCGAGTFTLVTRIKTDIEKLEVPTITCLPNYGQLPLVIEESEDFRSSLSHEKRLKIILEALQITSPSDVGFINEWPQFLKFWVATCLYYVRKLRKTNGFFIAVSIALSIIVSLLKLYSFPTNVNTKQQQPKENTTERNDNSKDNKNEEGKIVESISNLLKRQCMDAKLVKLFKIFDYLPEFKGKSFWRSYDISRVFYFSQYQSVVYHTYMLNILLGNPLKAPKLSTLNSHTVYNICTKITEIYYGKVSQFINKEFDNESPIKTILMKFLQYATGTSDISVCDAKLISTDNECKRSKKTKKNFRHEDSSTQLNRFMSLADDEEHS